MRGFLTYVLFFTPAVAGFLLAPLKIGALLAIVGGFILLLQSWEEYRPLLTKAADVDRQYREMGRWWKTHLYKRVIAIKLGNDVLALAACYMMGVGMRYVWAVDL